MKKTFFYFAFAFSSLFSFAQEWGSVGTVWIYATLGNADTEPYYEYWKYESLKDTLITEKNMHKVEFRRHSSDDGIQLLRTEYLFMEDNKVFFYKWGQFNLLYDFNLSVGETFVVQSPDDESYNGTIQVSSIDFPTINGTVYKMFQVFKLNDLGYPSYLIDQIGCEQDLLPTGQEAFPDDHPFLKCFITGDSLHYYDSFSYDFCNYFLTLDVNAVNFEYVRFYPNPVRDVSVLKIPDFWGELKHVRITSLNGQQFDNYTISKQELRINGTDFEPGVYFYQLTTDLHSFHGKFVVD